MTETFLNGMNKINLNTESPATNPKKSTGNRFNTSKNSYE